VSGVLVVVRVLSVRLVSVRWCFDVVALVVHRDLLPTATVPPGGIFLYGERIS
jgi:hypothetical protein